MSDRIRNFFLLDNNVLVLYDLVNSSANFLIIVMWKSRHGWSVFPNARSNYTKGSNGC